MVTVTDAIPWGPARHLLQMFPDPDIPESIEVRKYYAATCELGLQDGRKCRFECVVHRPPIRRNVVGVYSADGLAILLVADISADQIVGADVRVVRFGAEVDEGVHRRPVPPT